MTDTGTTAGPVAGWYADPAQSAPFRWWDGGHWTQETLDELPVDAGAETSHVAAVEPRAEERVADPAPRVVAAPDGSLPSRRSLRQRATDDTGPTSATVVAPGAPLNPLVAPTEPAANEPQTFTAPAAWIEHAPAAAPPPLGYGYGAGGPLPRIELDGLPRVSPDRNQPARWALTLPLLALVSTGLINGLLDSRALGTSSAAIVVIGVFGVLVILATIAAIPLGIIGLVRASRIKRTGLVPRGRPHAIAGLSIVGFVVFLGVIGAAAFVSTSGTTPTAIAPAPVTSVAPATVPDAGTPQDSGGTTTYVYSKALTQTQIAQAFEAKRITATGVTCPATEPLDIGTTFDCTASVDGAPVTVQVTVTSEQGQVEFQVIG